MGCLAAFAQYMLDIYMLKLLVYLLARCISKTTVAVVCVTFIRKACLVVDIWYTNICICIYIYIYIYIDILNIHIYIYIS